MKSTTPEWLEDMAVVVSCEEVDYTDETSLAESLEGLYTLNILTPYPTREHEKDEGRTDKTQVICTLLATDRTWASAQLNLLKSSLRSIVRRFASAEFGAGPRASLDIDILRPQIEVVDACRDARSGNPTFGHAGFYLGLSMNYLGSGARRARGENRRR